LSNEWTGKSGWEKKNGALSKTTLKVREFRMGRFPIQGHATQMKTEHLNNWQRVNIQSILKN
jgi:hypothetical protein